MTNKIQLYKACQLSQIPLNQLFAGYREKLGCLSNSLLGSFPIARLNSVSDGREE